ncbi:MAG: class I SAM-dependent methyltransferase family protein [Thermoplasmata archaeon]
MKNRALIVPRGRGEVLRRSLRDDGLLRTDLKILREGDRLALPIVEGRTVPEGVGEIAEREFERVRSPGPADYRDLISPEPEESARLPRSFDVVGDVVLVRIPEQMASRAGEIGAALLAFVPGARIVGSDRGVHGPERRRSLEVIAGSGDWRTRHRENGIEIEVDLERAYFSPRLAREHARVAAEVERGDRVYDLCCGVGPFALTIARDGRAGEITAVDSNPAAIELLRRSLALQKRASRVTVRTGSVEEFVPSAEPAERVILNLPHEGIKYLPSVARMVARRGRLYYYEVTPRTEFERRGEAVVRTLDQPSEWQVAGQHVVHPYSPGADLMAFTLERSREESERS